MASKYSFTNDINFVKARNISQLADEHKKNSIVFLTDTSEIYLDGQIYCSEHCVVNDYERIKALYDKGELKTNYLYIIKGYCYVPNNSYKEYTRQHSINNGHIILTVNNINSTFNSEGYFISQIDQKTYKIWYDIENNTSKYTWAYKDGQGIIYRMIDPELNIDAPFDFVNITIDVVASLTRKRTGKEYGLNYKDFLDNAEGTIQIEAWFKERDTKRYAMFYEQYGLGNIEKIVDDRSITANNIFQTFFDNQVNFPYVCPINHSKNIKINPITDHIGTDDDIYYLPMIFIYACDNVTIGQNCDMIVLIGKNNVNIGNTCTDMCITFLNTSDSFDEYYGSMSLSRTLKKHYINIGNNTHNIIIDDNNLNMFSNYDYDNSFLTNIDIGNNCKNIHFKNRYNYPNIQSILDTTNYFAAFNNLINIDNSLYLKIGDNCSNILLDDAYNMNISNNNDMLMFITCLGCNIGSNIKNVGLRQAICCNIEDHCYNLIIGAIENGLIEKFMTTMGKTYSYKTIVNLIFCRGLGYYNPKNLIYDSPLKLSRDMEYKVFNQDLDKKVNLNRYKYLAPYNGDIKDLKAAEFEDFIACYISDCPPGGQIWKIYE